MRTMTNTRSKHLTTYDDDTTICTKFSMATSNENLFIVVLKQKMAAVRASFVGSTSLVKPTQSEAAKELLCLLQRQHN